MRRVLLLSFLLVGCSNSPNSPTRPAPSPTPIPYPSMIGGWGGIWAATGSIIPNTCNSVWIFTEQDGNTFRGTNQTCTFSVNMWAITFPDGRVEVGAGSVFPRACVVAAGDTTFRGFLSDAGNVTVRQEVTLNCTSFGQPYTTTQVATYTMTRR